MTRFHVALLLLIAAVCVLVFAHPAFGATKPAFSIADASAPESAASVTLTISKSAVASSYSKVTVTTADGTAKAGVDYQPVNASITFGNKQLSASVPVPPILRSGYQGNRAFTARIAVTRNGVVSRSTATVTILETEQPPTPVPPPPPPPPPSGSWVAAPLTVGGYACNRLQAGTTNVPPCGGGVVLKIIATVTNSGTDGFVIYAAQFYSDASGQFPVNHPYDVSFVGYYQAADLQGLAPAP